MRNFNFLISVVVLSFLCFPLCAQTHYYKFIRFEGNGKSDAFGGQYVTINGNTCYESDANGFSIGNGVLHYYKSVDGGKCFEGSSFFGSGTKFYFSSNWSTLRIEVFNGENYYYQKSVPPQGVMTSSLIKGSSLSGNSQPSNPSIGGTTYNPSVPNSNNGTYNPTTTSSNNEDKAHWETYYRNSYSDWERRVQSTYNTIVEYKRKDSNSGGTSHNSFGSYTSSMISTFHQQQQEMRKVRQEAQTKGIRISPSSWETATISVY